MGKKKSGLGHSLYYSIICEFALYGFFLLVPLWLENRYFNLLQAKTHIFLLIAAVIAVLSLPALLLEWSGVRKEKVYPDTEDKLVLLYVVIAIISSFCSGHILESLLGLEAWGMGSLELLLGAVIFFLLKYHAGIIPKKTIWIIGTGIFLMLLLAVFHFAGKDLLGLHRGINPGLYYDYASTLGQKNMIAAFLCLILPAAMVLFADAKKIQETIGLIIFVIACFFCLILCTSDSAYLGLYLFAFFAVSFFTSDELKMKRLFVMTGFFGLALVFISLVPWFYGMVPYRNGLAGKIIDPWIGSCITIISGILYTGICCYTRRCQWLSQKKQKSISAGLQILMTLLFFCIIIWCICHFSDDFGSGRVMIWRHSWMSFLQYTPFQKLIGRGPETLRYTFQELSNEFGMNVFAAHSVPVQVLLSTGVFGLLIYLTLVFLQVRKYMAYRESQLFYLFFLPLAAFFGQSLVSSTMPMNFGIMCCFAGLLSNICRKEKGERK